MSDGQAARPAPDAATGGRTVGEDLVDERELLGYEVRELTRDSQGPDRLSIKRNDVFLITDQSGNITPPGATDLGLVWRDTRYLSHYLVSAPGRTATVLSNRIRNNSLAVIDMTFTGALDGQEFEHQYVHLRREQLIDAGFQERLILSNFNLAPIRFSLVVRFSTDFADLFEMRGLQREARGAYLLPRTEDGAVVLSYRGRDGLLRQTCLRFDPAPQSLTPREARFDLELSPVEKTYLRIDVALLEEDRAVQASIPFVQALGDIDEEYEGWRQRATKIRSNDEFLDTGLSQNLVDFRSLLMNSGGMPILSAGIPWYSVPFGRDAIIASLQTLSVQPEIAVSTLRFLAAHQGRKKDDWTEEEPGKIMHELRLGEVARCGEIPHRPYYGTVDATPLFIVLLHETINWLGDRALLQELMPAAEAALDWIDHHGDLDGDGFIEYQRRSPRGLVNQGWKDSYDAVIHPDGRLAEGPIALVEVQGYVYDARFRMADLYRMLGRTREANALMQEAQWLRNEIDAAFWQEDLGFYALALDGKKNPVKTITSNPGHLLWSRVPGPQTARRMRDVLLGESMFSGWGIRTLGRGQKPYNPVSYHNGTIWPHDNAIIAQGLCYYGFKESAARIFLSLYEAMLHFKEYRLPELFCGMSRRSSDYPVLYPVACNPQAWASGTFFQLLHALLGLQPDANRRELAITDPHLPSRLERVDYRDMRIGESKIALRFSRHEGRSSAHVLRVEGAPLKVNIAFG